MNIFGNKKEKKKLAVLSDDDLKMVFGGSKKVLGYHGSCAGEIICTGSGQYCVVNGQETRIGYQRCVEED